MPLSETSGITGTIAPILPEPIRSALFVPATRPERIGKALTSGADAVIVDLEDAVEPQAKAAARAHLADFVAAHPGIPLWVRINDAHSPWFADDLQTVRQLPPGSSVLLAKAQDARQVAAAAQAGHPVIALIETARAVLALGEIASAPGVRRLSFGALDLGLDMGWMPGSPGAEQMLGVVRSQLLLHSRAAGLAAPLDTVFAAIDDPAGLAAFARRACDMGFGGMLCIHPGQIATVHAAFAPDAAQQAWAQRVLEAAADNPAGAFRLAGQMIDAPVLARARTVLARAAAPEPQS